jgi:hypothetical protein
MMKRHAMRGCFLLHVARIVLLISLIVEEIATTGGIRRETVRAKRKVAIKARVMKATIT